MAATLLIHTSEGSGSGVLISPDGFALTSAHVLGADERVTVVTHDKTEHEAVVVRVDERQDVALLKVKGKLDAACVSPAWDDPELGTEVFVLGSPGGEALSFSVSKGIVAGHRDFEGYRFLQVDAAINPGNSGGPVLDDSATLLGIAGWKLTGGALEGLAFAVPVATALSELEVTLADSTDPRWASAGGRKVVIVAPTPARLDTYIDTADRKARYRRWRGHRMMVRGGVTAGLGLVALVAAAIPYQRHQDSPAARASMLATMGTGGGLMGLGAVFVAVGAALRYGKRSKDPSPIPNPAVANAGTRSSQEGQLR